MSSNLFRTLAVIFVTALLGAGVALLLRENGSTLLASIPGERGDFTPNWSAIAAVLGAAAAVLLLVLWTKQRRPFVIATVLLVYVILGWLLFGPWITLYTSMWVLIVLFFATEPLRVIYGGNRFDTFVQHLRVWLTMNGSPVIVADGKTSLPATAGPHLGPRMVIVRPGNAVVMTSGASVTRICGPSVFQSRRFEYVSQVLPLAKRRRSLRVTNVLTLDQLPVDVHLSFVYDLAVSDDTIEGRNATRRQSDGSIGLTAAERLQLRQIVNLAADWEMDVRAVIEGAAHNVIGGYSYGPLVSSANYQRLAGQITGATSALVQQLGAQLLSVSVASVTPRAELIEALTDSERIRMRHVAQGLGFRGAITAVAFGYRDAIRLGLTVDDIHREAVHYMLQHMASDPATKILMGMPE